MAEGTLGKGLPRFYSASTPPKSDGDGWLRNHIVTVAGIRDGKALVEISAEPGVSERMYKDVIGKDMSFVYRLRVRARIRDDAPWFRALVPLQGSVSGTKVQIRTPLSFPDRELSFTSSISTPRRGILSRHMTNAICVDGATDMRSSGFTCTIAGSDLTGEQLGLPIDKHMTLVSHYDRDTKQASVEHISGGTFMAKTLQSNRALRRDMRANAMDVLQKVSAAVSTLDLDSPEYLQNAMLLQDVLGMDKHDPDFSFAGDVEATAGRGTGSSFINPRHAAGVLCGAVHTGTRALLFEASDAKYFISTVKNLKATLMKYEDGVFSSDNRFSSKLSVSPEYAQILAKAGVTII
jgi:hypothetical protein